MPETTPDHGNRLAADADSAIRQLYGRHTSALRRYVARYCADRATADDIAQETFIRAWRHLPRLSADDRPVRPWLFRVARNLLIDADRAARVRPAVSGSPPAEDGRPDDGLDQVLDRELVAAALQRLSPAHQAVLVETFYHDASLAGAARTLGIPPGTARSRLHYALQALRRQLDQASAAPPARAARGWQRPGRYAAQVSAGAAGRAPGTGSDHDVIQGSDERLRQFARGRRFLLGRPRDLAFVPDPDRLLFLRSLAADDAVTGLWSLDLATGAERLLADPRELLGGAPEVVPAAELARRERMRETGRGIVAYSLGADGRRAAFMLSGRLFSCHLGTGVMTEIPAAGPVIDPQLRPDGTAVAYLAGRALRVTGLDGQVLLELADPDPEVSFGAAEFGAAEEMSRQHGYWWSPDGRQLLVARVSEHAVASWWLGDPADAAPEPVRQRYPFAGTANPDVALLVASLDGQATKVDVPGDELPYLLAARWDAAGPLLALHTRDHGRSEYRAVDPETGVTRLLRAGTNPDWLELIPGTPHLLPDGRLLHAAHSQDTHRLFIGDQPVTPAGLQVTSVTGSTGGTSIFCAAPEPTERHVYSLDHHSGEVTRLAGEPGLHSAVADGSLLAISSETLDHDGITVRVLRGGQQVAAVGSLAQPAFAPGVTLLSAGERELRTAVIFPRDDLRPGGPLPVVMAPYGGPAQQVLRARRLFYEPQWLADQGFAVIVADGRGSPGRGPAWERAFRFDVATAALEDQVAALEHVVARYPGELDPGRVGIRGWSFGGYLSALAVLRRPDVFAAAIAGAPVSEWRWYDSVATERYLGDPGEHPEAYDRSSLFPDAAGLSRPLLLVHGLTDDNVHPRHSLALSRALAAAGRDHELLLLPGVTHITWQPETIELLLAAHVRFFRRWLAPGAQAPGARVAG